MSKIKSAAFTTILLLILCISVAYTSYSATMAINGTANETNDWNLFFKQVTTDSSEGDLNVNSPTITNNRQTIKLSPIINTPNSYITYTVTIENNGLVDAIADKDFITWNLEKDSPNIEYEVSFPGNVKKGDEVTFEIKFYTNDIINEELNSTTEILTGTLNYKRAE